MHIVTNGAPGSYPRAPSLALRAIHLVAPYGTGKSSDKLLSPPSYLLPFFLLLTEVCFLNRVIIQQIGRLAGLDDFAGFEDVASVRDGQRLLCVLLYKH